MRLKSNISHMMIRKGYMAILLWSICFVCQAQTTHYEIDPKRSTISFSVTHMRVLTVQGNFAQFSGSFLYDSTHKELKSIQSTIQANSIDTNDSSRDKTLIGKAYLNTEIYPHITFRASKVTSHTITGMLQIKDITKEISIPYTYIDSKNTEDISIKMSVILDRNDFDLDFGAMNMLVGNDITVELIIYHK